MYNGGGFIPRALKYGTDYFNGNMSGDLNSDNIVNIIDIIIIINIILGEDDNIDNADINNDGIINILDAIQLVNIILN